MNQLVNIFILLIIQAIAVHSWCHHSSRCNHRRHDYKSGIHADDGDFHELSWNVVHADRKAQRVCHENANHTTETFYTNHYEISVSLPEFEEDQISLKLKYRVLFIQAVKGNVKTFSELKVLPEFVKGSAATWRFEDKELKVYVPYEVTLGTEVLKVCNSPIDDSVITIPKAGIDVRFGNDETTFTPLNEESF